MFFKILGISRLLHECCKNCKHMDLNDKRVEIVNFDVQCEREEVLYYCKKQQRYIRLYDFICNDYNEL